MFNTYASASPLYLCGQCRRKGAFYLTGNGPVPAWSVSLLYYDTIPAVSLLL